ncbi:MAG: PBP1A family penicillin-binding protein [Chloroflexi bacterium]|nr:PBP1A family penicillin-binding protein [Chloroflexota bacterium]MBI3339955.1 PBP1A family penicillin-binding protein [Chloroflexota bacterium]
MTQDDPRDKFRRLLNSEDETRAEPPSQPTRGAQPPLARPALDKDNMPLPRRVDEIDTDGTRVTPAAYETRTSRRNGTPPPVPPRSSWSRFNFRNAGCLIRGLIVVVFILVVAGVCLGSLAVYEYYSIASSLPSISDLQQRASQFETTRILDRNGNLLYEIIDPNAGRRTYVTLDKISPALAAATIATEDKEFYNHPGYDVWAIMRAIWQNYTSKETVSGASTITQQLARAILLSPDERRQQTYFRKAREIILAAEITRRYSKDEILELYLNEIYYGNLAYGIEAAAETYFGTTAGKLTLAQASFLAGLPQSPAVYDIFTNREITLARQQQVLTLMIQASYEQNCIRVSNSPSPVCVDPAAAANAAVEVRDYTFQPPAINMRYPHWVNYVRSQLESSYDAQTIYRSGFTIYTTLDPNLQDYAQQVVTSQVATLTDKNATDGALVAIKPSTGEILAMVGSADFYNTAISGQVNMAVSQTRQPGSSIKPINYVAAFEKGWTPATLIWDVPSEFPPSGDPNDTREPYKPVNYDGKFHGPVTVRTALSNSFNVPAVKTLQFVGVYGDQGMVAMAARFGITSLTRSDYGLSLTLGGGDVSLLQMTGAFAVFANGGVRVPPVSILKIVDFQGKVVYEYKPPQGEQVVSPEHAYLITSILSDNEARAPMFGANSVLNLPFPVAAKTGTSNDFRDNWTLGYTPDLVAGVWVGNADYTPMINTTGLTGAAPIWSQFMQNSVPYLTQGNPSPFIRPAGIVDRVICSISGTEPSNWCKGGERSEIFASDQLPLPASQDLRRQIKLDTWTGLEASNACKDFTNQQIVINVSDPWARKWFETKDGRNWLDNNGFPTPPIYTPERECGNNDPRPTLDLSVSDGAVISQTTLAINGTADATGGFKSWRLEFGLGSDPDNWTTLSQGDQPVKNGQLFNWDMSNLPNGVITLHLYLTGANGYAERFVPFTLQVSTPTPPPTDTPFPTPTDTPVVIPDTPTDTPVPTGTSTDTPPTP